MGEADFEFEVTFAQPWWTGGFGVYFRAAAEPPTGRNAADCESVVVKRPAVAKEMTVYRGQRRGYAGRDGRFDFDVARTPGLVPAGREATLRVAGGPSGLTSAAWAGQELPAGIAAPDPLFLAAPPPSGGVGILVASNSVSVTQARIRIREK